MSFDPAEPEKYSLDEMLDRLQAKPPPSRDDSGELVTRADGSNAIKVRKRKRRTSQPQKEAATRSSRMRVIQISAGLILLILLGFTFSGLLVYTNTPGYRAGLLEKVSSFTGAKTRLNQLRVTPTTTNAALADFVWEDGGIFKSLMLSDVRSKALLLGVIGDHWGADEIVVSNGRLNLGMAQPGTTARKSPAKDKPLISFERLGIQKLDVVFGDPAKSPLQVFQTEASFYSKSANGKPSIRLYRGNVKIPAWPPLRLERGLIEIVDSKAEIVSMQLLHELDRPGKIQLSGIVDPEQLSRPQTLDVELDGFEIDGLAGESVGRLVAGKINSRKLEGSPNKASFSIGSDAAAKLSVAFVSSPDSFTELNGFPFLSVLAKLFNDPWLSKPIFERNVSGVFHREKGQVRFSNLSMVDKAHLNIAGELIVRPDESLSGTLQVGIPEAAVIATSNTKLKAIFSESGEGYRWIRITLSGSASRPSDNFGGIYDETVASPVENAAPGSFEELTAPPK